MIVTAWFDDPHRSTRDVDFLGFGDSSAQAVRTVWKDICQISLDDGITFDTDALRADPIRDDVEYGGLRLNNSRPGRRENIDYH
jgi:hypothetical protein